MDAYQVIRHLAARPRGYWYLVTGNFHVKHGITFVALHFATHVLDHVRPCAQFFPINSLLAHLVLSGKKEVPLCNMLRSSRVSICKLYLFFTYSKYAGSMYIGK